MEPAPKTPEKNQEKHPEQKLAPEVKAAEPQIVVAAPTKAHEQPPIAAGKSTAEYVTDAMEMHYKQYKGKQPPALLKWAGDAALAVLPMNRMYCAIGLTTGLMIAGNTAKIATGFGLDGKAVEQAKVPTFLNKLYKVVKDYNPKGLDKRNQYIKYAQWAAYSAGGFLGIQAGTYYAYKSVYKKNKNPKTLEDYLSRVSMHQGDTFSWLAGISGIFGSSSGLFSVPVPGVNYALSLAGRTTSMQDRNIMLKGMNEWISGASTTSYLRLREGIHYMCHYAVGNPAETPAQLEFLAYTLLGPIFKDELKPEHIQQFVNAVHEVRDAYWQPGGIPKDKRKEAVATMQEVFTGAGLEALLINMGLNPGTIEFDKLNGMVGKVGNVLAEKAVVKEQKNYQDMLEQHIAIFEKQGIISHERAQWALDGIDASRHGKPAPKWDNTPEGSKEKAEAISQSVLAGAADVAASTPGEAAVNDNTQKNKEFSAGADVSLGAATRKNPVENLIKAAEKDKGDWREQALHQKQETQAPGFVVE